MLFYNSNTERKEKPKIEESSCFRAESNTQKTDKGAATRKIRNHTHKHIRK